MGTNDLAIFLTRGARVTSKHARKNAAGRFDKVLNGTDVRLKKEFADNGLGELPGVASPVLMRPIYAGRLKTNADWLRLSGKIMRAALRGDMPLAAAARLFYMTGIGASMAAREQEAAQLEALRSRLEALGVIPSQTLSFDQGGGFGVPQVISDDQSASSSAETDA